MRIQDSPHSVLLRVLPHVFWALVAIGTFAIGYIAGDSPTAPLNAGLGATPNAGGSRTDDPTLGSSETTKSGQPAAVILTGEQVRVRTFEILAEPNDIVRMRLLCELLDHITPDNWRDCIRGFVLQTAAEGRTHDTEWYLMLGRVGEVAGAEAIKEAGGLDRARSFLTGWASADPKAARAWFETQPPEMQEQLLGTLLQGIARTDPKTALEMAFTQPVSVMRENVSKIIPAALQHGGFREVEGLLASVMNRADLADPDKSAVFFYLTQGKIRSANAAGNPAKTLDWFEPYLGVSYIGSTITQDLISNAAKAGAPAVMDWLGTHADRMSPQQADAAFPAIATSWQAQAPDQFAAWMSANHDHPQYDAMAQTTVNSYLRNGQTEMARQWAASIQNPEVRARLDQAIQKAAEDIRGNQQK